MKLAWGFHGVLRDMSIKKYRGQGNLTCVACSRKRLKSESSSLPINSGCPWVGKIVTRQRWVGWQKVNDGFNLSFEKAETRKTIKRSLCFLMVTLCPKPPLPYTSRSNSAMSIHKFKLFECRNWAIYGYLLKKWGRTPLGCASFVWYMPKLASGQGMDVLRISRIDLVINNMTYLSRT